MLVEDTEIQRPCRFRRIDVPARLRRQTHRVPPGKASLWRMWGRKDIVWGPVEDWGKLLGDSAVFNAMLERKWFAVGHRVLE